MVRLLVLFLFVFFSMSFNSGIQAQSTIYLAQTGEIEFVSDAPLELIEAKSDKLSGVLDVSKRTFSFAVPIKTFEGFNSSLQRTHFNENYLESNKYPNGKFSGKIIEEVDFNVPGTYNIRAKGVLLIHGQGVPRIIKCKIVITKNSITVTSKFSVFLDEHKIKIPSIVYQKIAEEITVDVKSKLIQKK